MFCVGEIPAVKGKVHIHVADVRLSRFEPCAMLVPLSGKKRAPCTFWTSSTTSTSRTLCFAGAVRSVSKGQEGESWKTLHAIYNLLVKGNTPICFVFVLGCLM